MELVIAITDHNHDHFFLGPETQKLINCEHVIVQRVVLPFCQLKFNKIHPVRVNYVRNISLTTYGPCLRSMSGKFELTNQDSAGEKNFTVLKSI